jgi:subtilisin family serine protease
VSGIVSGLTGPGLGLQIQLNDSAPLGVENGSFTFTPRVAPGATFIVTVARQPTNETCAISNGGGVMPLVSVTNVSVVCSTLAGFTIAGLSDPLTPQQWHLKNTGQTGFADTPGVAGFDINVDPVFGLGFTGSGVTVAVVDSGIEIAHEDLSANIVPGGSWNFNNGTTDPTNTAIAGDHGTSVSGLIAMVKNGVGGIGVAPGARLKGFNILSVPLPTEVQFLDSIGASSAAPNSSDVFVFNESFGTDTNTPLLIDPLHENQYRAATAGPGALRSGRGAIYVKASGNGFQRIGNVNCVGNVGTSCENANFDPDNTVPFQIIVGATNASGIKSSYSTAGSALWVSAPGGEFGENAVVSGNSGVALQPALVTTDQSGCAIGTARIGATTSSFDQGSAPNTQCNYTNTMNGTSSAAPVTSGVIALMLEANPALTWRDVKHILASTARKIDASGGVVNVTLPGGTYSAEPGWTNNHASPTPFHYHNWYGFGLIDAGAAVTMAKTYSVNLGNFTDTGFISTQGLSVVIPDNNAAGVTSMLPVPAGSVAVIEEVQIRVTLTHPSVRDLGIEVISPAGTRSVIKNIEDGYLPNQSMTNQIFLTNAFYGENPTGTWSIKVVDAVAGNSGILTGWAVRAYGH